MRHRGARDPAREERLERATAHWAFLPPLTPAAPESQLDDLLHRAASSLAEFRLLAAGAGQGGPLALDDQLHRLVALEDTLMRRLGEIALEFSRRGAWVTLGFKGTGHYAERRLGLPATVLEDRVAVARRLACFPRLRDAYERGALGLDALLVVLRTLGRGPVPDDVERAWLARAREATVKRLRDEARALARRDLELAPEAGDDRVPPDGQGTTDVELLSEGRMPAKARAPAMAKSLQLPRCPRMLGCPRSAKSPRPPRCPRTAAGRRFRSPTPPGPPRCAARLASPAAACSRPDCSRSIPARTFSSASTCRSRSPTTCSPRSKPPGAA